MAAVLAVVALAVSGCGNPDFVKLREEGTVEAPRPVTPRESLGAECAPTDVQVAGQIGVAPQVTVPRTCDPPAGLTVRDLAAGAGAPAAPGDMVSFNYVQVAWSSGKISDNSYERGIPVDVPNIGKTDMTAADVIDGWNEGLLGTRKGMRRVLIVPPDKGYGNNSPNPDVAPGDHLVFVMDIVNVVPAGTVPAVGVPGSGGH